MGWIYQIKNLINNKIYVGQTCSKYVSTRWSAHKLEAKKGNSNKPLYKAFLKYGFENMEFKILLKNVPNESLFYYEKLWIKKLKSLSPNGYNLCEGGISLKGSSNPMYDKIPWNKGKKHTTQSIEKMKKSFTKEKIKLISERVKGDKNPMFGKTKEKNPMFGVKHTKECIENIKLNQPYRKMVSMYLENTYIRTFNSLADAANYIRINTNYTKADYSTIAKSIKKNWKCYGFRFEFV
jgi:group I intron endonuclease